MEEKQTLIEEEKQTLIEKIFEKGLWNARFIILTSVVCSLIACIALFIFGSLEIGHILHDQISHWVENDKPDYHAIHSKLLINFITAIDLYLVGVVFLLFSFGIYELFISKIDIARKDDDAEILEVENLDELKNKIIKVIIMVLIVAFFAEVIKYIQANPFTTTMDMLLFALSILSISIGVFLIKKKS